MVRVPNLMETDGGEIKMDQFFNYTKTVRISALSQMIKPKSKIVACREYLAPK